MSPFSIFSNNIEQIPAQAVVSDICAEFVCKDIADRAGLLLRNVLTINTTPFMQRLLIELGHPGKPDIEGIQRGMKSIHAAASHKIHFGVMSIVYDDGYHVDISLHPTRLTAAGGTTHYH